ncbi:MAG: hypothetical protein RR515_05525 [Clostridium sp.]
MSKEMNNLRWKITKYDMMSGLFMSLIIGVIFSFQVAIVYILGVAIGATNFIASIYAVNKWLLNNKVLIISTTFLRIFIISFLILPFIHEPKLLIAYIGGFISHYVVLIYCSINKKGSA